MCIYTGRPPPAHCVIRVHTSIMDKQWVLFNINGRTHLTMLPCSIDHLNKVRSLSWVYMGCLTDGMACLHVCPPCPDTGDTINKNTGTPKVNPTCAHPADRRTVYPIYIWNSSPQDEWLYSWLLYNWKGKNWKCSDGRWSRRKQNESFLANQLNLSVIVCDGYMRVRTHAVNAIT